MEDLIDRYQLVRKVGGGGYGSVYLANDPDLNRNVAIKVLESREGLSIDPAAFDRECKAIGAVSNHPQIVSVYDFGKTSGGQPYIVMEYCGGGTLLDLIRDGPVPYPKAVRIGIRVAEALERAHRDNILHRDVKPANILFSDYTASLADFGIADLAGVETSAGGLTYQYSAPEVLDRNESSTQSDIYSLGATIYTALNGRRPFSMDGHNSPSEVIQRVLQNDVPPIEHQTVPTDLETYVRRMMAKAPVDRPRSATDVVAKLRTFVDSHDDDRTVPAVATTAPDTPGTTPDEPRTASDDNGDRWTKTERTVHDPVSPERDLSRALDEPANPKPVRSKSSNNRRAIAAVAAVAIGVAGYIGYWATSDRSSAELATPTSTSIEVIESPPATLTDVSLDRQATGDVVVTWSGDANAVGYRIAIVGGEIFETTTTEFTLDPTVVPDDEVLCVSVVGYNSNGRTGAESEPACLAP